MKKYLLAPVLCLYILTNCSSPKKLYNKGKYDAVVRLLDNKAGKGNLSNEEIQILSKAIKVKLGKEEQFLEEKLNSNKFEDWHEGYQHLDKVVEMQNEYATFNQLKTEEFDWVTIQDWDTKFSDVLYTHHVSTYQEMYDKYRRSRDKNAIIDAYYELENVRHFDKGEINIDSLQSAFEDEGLRNITVEFQDESFNLFELRHLRYNVNPSGSKWSNFGIHDNPDYTAYVCLLYTSPSPRDATLSRMPSSA